MSNTVIKKIRNIAKYFSKLEVCDSRLIVSIIFLTLFGIIMIYSAGASSSTSVVIKQFLIAVAGFVLMILISYVDYHWYIQHAMVLFGGALLSLGLIFTPLSTTSHGAQRWVTIPGTGGMTFQPSELLKPAIIILTAMLLKRHYRQLKSIQQNLIIFLPGVISAGLIYKITNNLSTALIVASISFLMIFIVFPDKRIYAVLGIIFVVLIIGILNLDRIIAMLPTDSHVTQRLEAWFHPELAGDDGRQTMYSLYSIGSGGLFGKGLGNGIMKYYLPESTNDFIFAVIAEELGIVGCSCLMFLFIYQIWRLIKISSSAADKEGTFIAAGIGIHIILQVLFNIGVATGVLPNTGISLPYVSSGGTALLLQMAEMGIALNISRQIPGKRIRQGEGGVQRQTAVERAA